MNNDIEIRELLQVVKSSDGSTAFIELLKRVVERVADVRNEVDKKNDSIELRAGIVKVIEDELIKPLMSERREKKIDQSIDYT